MRQLHLSASSLGHVSMHQCLSRDVAKDEEWLAIALGLTTVSETHAPELTKRAERALARDAGAGEPRWMSVASFA